MGRSSAGPCRRPSATACPTGTASPGRDIGPRLGPTPPAPPAHDEVDDADNDGGGHGVVDVAQRVLPLVPLPADLVPDEREHEHPRDAAQERDDAKAPERHAGSP